MWDKLSTYQLVHLPPDFFPHSNAHPHQRPLFWHKKSQASFPGNLLILLRDIDEGIPVLLKSQQVWVYGFQETESKTHGELIHRGHKGDWDDFLILSLFQLSYFRDLPSQVNFGVSKSRRLYPKNEFLQLRGLYERFTTFPWEVLIILIRSPDSALEVLAVDTKVGFSTGRCHFFLFEKHGFGYLKWSPSRITFRISVSRARWKKKTPPILLFFPTFDIGHKKRFNLVTETIVRKIILGDTYKSVGDTVPSHINFGNFQHRPFIQKPAWPHVSCRRRL